MHCHFGLFLHTISNHVSMKNSGNVQYDILACHWIPNGSSSTDLTNNYYIILPRSYVQPSV